MKANELKKIIEACGSAGVKSIKFGDVQISFESEEKKVTWSIETAAPVAPIELTAEQKQALEEQRHALEEEQMNLLDPVGYMEKLERGPKQGG